MDKFFTLISTVTLTVLGSVTQAQTCSGEIVKFKETFGTGSRTSLPTGRTNYSYKKSGSLSDGDYALISTSQGKPEWHASPDHTGDVNGLMMVTNASFAPGEFYRDTVYGVSSVSTYNIYFYAMNVNTVGTCSPNPILPQLELVVESYNLDGSFTQIYSMVSGYLPQTTNPAWVKVSGQFYLPIACTAVRYRIINHSTGGCGNDLAIDDITFSQCQPVLLSVSGLDLKGNSDRNGAYLSWSTLSENYTDKFVIEKSADEKHWKPLTSVKAAGQSSAKKEYSAVDKEPFSPVCYYRVVSSDGVERPFYSNTIALKFGTYGNALVSIHPNPFDNNISIELESARAQNASVKLFDLSGKLVKTATLPLGAGFNSIALTRLEHLESGMYFLSVCDFNGMALCEKKVLKQ